MVREAAALGSVVPLLLAASAARPNLVESRVDVSQQGTTLRVTDATRNTAAVSAPASRTGYYLGSVRVGTRPVRALAPGATSRGSVTVKVPTSVARGTYRLRACADIRRAVRESREGDNCKLSTQKVSVGDRTPPVFKGIESASTCLPGPAGNGRKSSFHLTWSAATDNETPAKAIVYDVYQASVAGGETFTSPTYTTDPGVTEFSTPPLSGDSTWYFVVRARDQAGNRDANRVEQQGMNRCL